MRYIVHLSRIIVTLAVSVALFSACSSLELDVYDGGGNGSYHRSAEEQSKSSDFPWAKTEGVRNVLRRASQLANITWTPILDVPGNAGAYPAGIEVLGIPYSSTKQIDKYVGQDVSFHTFMTAVHNPRSVLYTENLRNAPYYGSNCASYYGTVCSSAVAYALNLDVPFPSSYFPTLPGFYKVPDQNLESLVPGDVLQRPGHVFMIYKVDKNELGTVTNVSYFEAASRYARISTTSAISFKERLEKDGYVAYRYDGIDDVDQYESSPYVAVGSESVSVVKYNDSLCPNRGDKSVYRVGEPVVINILDDSYASLIVEGAEGFSFEIDDDIKINNLLPGVYDAYLTDGVRKSKPISFLVAEPKVIVENNGQLHIVFSCDQGIPSYCVLCDRVGSFKSIHVITAEEADQGYIDIEPLDVSSYFCKVVFDTTYGTVVNEPIKVTHL